MGRRLTRKQIKQDEFISLVDRGIHWMGGNWRQAAYGLGGVLAVALLWWGVTTFVGSRTEAGAQALSDALAIYESPAGATSGAKTAYATDSERLAAAEKAFESVRSKYWLTPQAGIADLYLARIAADRGDTALAIRKLGEITSKRSSSPLVRLAMLDLIRLRVSRGEGQQLVGELEAMASGKDPRLPRDVALFELGRMWEREGKPEEASRIFRKLVEDFPESPYRTEAQQRLSTSS